MAKDVSFHLDLDLPAQGRSQRERPTVQIGTAHVSRGQTEHPDGLSLHGFDVETGRRSRDGDRIVCTRCPSRTWDTLAETTGSVQAETSLRLPEQMDAPRPVKASGGGITRLSLRWKNRYWKSYMIRP